MKTTIGWPKRFIAMFLCMVMLTALLPTALHVAADSVNRVVDPSTAANWQDYFGPNQMTTQYAGGVWMDKSVYLSASAVSNKLTMVDPQNNFLVALSAIAANKTIVGYSTLPTDTMLVLDLSSSMSSGNLTAMVTATNSAINELYKLSNYNRVGVVLYSGNTDEDDPATAATATVILPLDRYTGVTAPGATAPSYLRYNSYNSTISVVNGVEDSDGQAVSGSKSAAGGTYIQNGLYKAWQEFEKVTDTVIPVGEPQAGTKRTPVIVLMSDGAPTIATSAYNSVGTSNVGDGTSSTNPIGFLTQLTAAYVRGKMEAKYDNAALFYTLGLGVENNNIAQSVLNPANSPATINGYWRTYNALTYDADTQSYASMSLSIGNNRQQYIQKDPAVQTQYYVDEAFTASDSTGLIRAFNSIVNEIVIQSRYYPTMVEDGEHDFDGYITFEDELGDYMEVKNVQGLLLNDTYYSGLTMSENFVSDGGTLGTEANPTATGTAFIHAVSTRLGLTKAEAIDLVKNAYKAGQLSYTPATGTASASFSNYIGWYADANNNFLGFWNDKDEGTVPAGTVYRNRSYGFLGRAENGIRSSDMMYVSVQVHTHIETGHQTVIWKIPASLVPLVTYEVTLNTPDIDSATEITLERKDTNPLQLVFEVGLRSDITPLNITEMLGSNNRNTDGTYTFYSNRWVRSEGEGVYLPSQHQNTVAWFHPSAENERYYYTEDTEILVKNGSTYTVLTTAPKTDGSVTYYHEFVVFEATGSGNEAQTVSYYEEVSATSLALAQKDTASDRYYIPKGTVYRNLTSFEQTKTENPTDTIRYAHYPYVQSPSGTTEYQELFILGNNGRLTVEPAQGLVLTKSVDTIEPGTNPSFIFDVALTAPTGVTLTAVSYRHEKADGSVVVGTYPITSGSQAALAVTIQAGDTLYLTDLPTGTSYTVTEQSHEDYVLSTINGKQASSAAGTVSQYTLNELAFHNVLIDEGLLLIQKQVTHQLGDDFELGSGHIFTAEIALAGTGLPATVTTSRLSDGEIAVVDGKFTLTLRAGESVAVYGIPKGTSYTVTETNMPAGFSLLQTSVGLSGTIPREGSASVTLVNEYNPHDVTGDITVVGTKYLDGRDWLATDSFTFELSRFNGSTWESIATKTTTKENPSFDFSAEMAHETFSAIGTYSYRIAETPGVIGGITYDTRIRYFDVIVADSNSDGYLEIQSIYADQSVSASQDADGMWTVTANFTNVYAPAGSASVEIAVQKQILTTIRQSVSLSGFAFGVYDANGTLVGREMVTDSNGRTAFRLFFTPEDVGKTFTYTVKEIVPDEPIPGMKYDETVYTLTVAILDNLDGTVRAVFVDEDGNEGAATTTLPFTNTYQPTAAQVTLTGNKTLNGRDMEADEFTFLLYVADENFSIVGSALDSATNRANGVFTFDLLTFDKLGTYRYVVKEDTATAIGGVAFDMSHYHVTVEVTDGGEGALTAAVSYVKVAADGTHTDVAGLAFTNTYSTGSASAVISGQKTLNGRPMTDGEFTFLLYPANASGEKTSNTAKTAVNVNGVFTFETLTFEAADTYYFRVEEDASRKLAGITYDASAYLVAITVRDDGEGNLVVTSITRQKLAEGEAPATVSTITFTNAYTVSSTSYVLSGKKGLTGRNQIPGEFSFDLYHADANGRMVGDAFDTAETRNVEGDFTFKTISYSAPGVYRYVVKENSDDALPGVTYDAAEYLVTVTVQDNGAGQLSVDRVTYVKRTATSSSTTTAITFTNTYRASSVTAGLSGKKTLNGRSLKAGEFTFLLYAADANFNVKGDVLQSVQNKADKTFTFSHLTFTSAGVYRYLVKESTAVKLGGVTYDSNAFRVTVTVTDDGTGKLTASVSYQKQTAGGAVTSVSGMEFVNSYSAGYTYVSFSGNKTLYGRTLKAKDFAFELYQADANFNTIGTARETVTNEADGSFAFQSRAFDPGTYYYVVKEVIPEDVADGVSYDASVFLITVQVTDGGQGVLTTTVTYRRKAADGTVTTEDGIRFVNRYQAASTTLALGGHKTLNGRDLAANDFSFILSQTDENFTAVGQPEIVKNDGNGNFTFQTKKFVRAGIYHYLVKEDVTTTLPGVTYDTNVYRVTVTVTDPNGAGQLSASATYEKVAADGTITKVNAIEFVNSYSAEAATVTLIGSKTLNGRDQKAGEFTFVLSSAENYGDVIPEMPLKAVTLDGGSFTFETLTFTKAGTYVFTVIEDATEKLPGVSYDATEYRYTVTVTDNGNGVLTAAATLEKVTEDGLAAADALTFTNTYTPKAVSVTLSGEKTLNGRPLKEGEFSFQLYVTDEEFATIGDPETVVNDKNGIFSFHAISFNKVGTYRFLVKEDATNALGGVSYDPCVFRITVEVTDKGEGQLTALTTYEKYDGSQEATAVDTIVFVNTYSASSATATLIGSKILNGRAQKAGEFAFLLSAIEDYDGLTSEVPLKAVTLDGGSFTFETLTFTKTGTYVFVVTEDASSMLPGVTYDATEYLYTVTVTDDGEGALTAETKLEKVTDDGLVAVETLAFTNTFKAAETQVKVEVEKLIDNLTNETVGKDGFLFTLEGESLAEKLSAVTDTNGFASFLLRYHHDDIGKSFTYFVREADTGIEGMVYSQKVYAITVTISQDENGELVASLTVDEEAVEAVQLIYINVYEGVETPPVSPDTGSDLILWMALAVVSGSVALAVSRRRRKA